MENYIRTDNGIIVASPSSIFSQSEFCLHANEQYAIFLLEENYDCYAVEFFKQDEDIRIRTLEYSEFDCEFSILDTFIVSKTNWDTLVESYGGSEELIYDLLDFLEDSKEKTYNKLKEAYEIDNLIKTVINLSEFRDLKIWQIFNHWDEIDDFFRRKDEEE